MGEARRRGTREERAAAAVACEAERHKASQEAEEARWAALTPEQRREELEARRRGEASRLRLHSMLAMAMGLNAGRRR